MLAATQNLTIDVFFMMPSCVPATPLDESGAEILANISFKIYEMLMKEVIDTMKSKKLQEYINHICCLCFV